MLNASTITSVAGTVNKTAKPEPEWYLQQTYLVIVFVSVCKQRRWSHPRQNTTK